MARKPTVNYWPSRGSYVDAKGHLVRGGYWTTIGGVQHLLAAGPKDDPYGPTYDTALKVFRQELAQANASHAGNANTCYVVLEHYVRMVLKTKTAATLRVRQRALDAFCKSDLAELGRCRAHALPCQSMA